ncbi:ABC-2 transporter permease [Oceanirhabdus seepicola]|uniref:ABC-2 transporter permease n=1 Tax=Oceanirhabdus seepicola TaxID=2828781 RepID=A0A9J6P6C2_9CLOT|nr:ABC-2 transporter permease [Oceanirhabdus seepicola]
MLSLLYKDFKLQKIGIKSLIIGLGILFIVGEQSNIENFLYLIGLPLLIYSYVITGITYDGYYKVEGVIVSLPITKDEIVLGKYINLIISMVLSGVLAIGIIFAASLKFDILFGEFFNLRKLFLSLGGAAFFVALLMPAYLKYGLIKGKLLTFIAMFVLFGINTFFSTFDELKLRIIESNYSMVIMIVLFIAGILVSYSVSLKVYKGREF